MTLSFGTVVAHPDHGLVVARLGGGAVPLQGAGLVLQHVPVGAGQEVRVLGVVALVPALARHAQAGVHVLLDALAVEQAAGQVARGLRVSTVKHAHHSFDVDHPGKDSHRHRLAGAGQVLVTSAQRWALMSELGDAPEPPLADHLARLDPVDLVLVEGYKRDDHPKVETHRSSTGNPLIAPDDPTVRAVASDVPLELDRPVFDLNDTGAIADFILAEVGL